MYYPKINHLLHFVAILYSCTGGIICQQQSSPLVYNGGCAVAMAGKNCVALAVDTRFGSAEQLVSKSARRVLAVNPRLLCALTGLATDAQTVMQDLRRAIRTKELQEGCQISARAAASVISTFLYSRRNSPLYCEPIVAGLCADGSPYICVQDFLGARSYPKDFAVLGTPDEGLYGTCEAFYRTDMSEDELHATISQCLAAAVERDCLSGGDIIIYMVSTDGMTVTELQSRRD
jgi:20S proteasome subunit beta 3